MRLLCDEDAVGRGVEEERSALKGEEGWNWHLPKPVSVRPLRQQQHKANIHSRETSPICSSLRVLSLDDMRQRNEDDFPREVRRSTSPGRIYVTLTPDRPGHPQAHVRGQRGYYL